MGNRWPITCTPAIGSRRVCSKPSNTILLTFGRNARNVTSILGSNPRAYALALERRCGFGILQTLERRAKLYFDYTIPVLERMTTMAEKGAHEYFVYYESIRPKEEKEIAKAA
jgi:hypothetical protein